MYELTLLVVFVLLVGLSWIGAPYPRDLVLQHVPTLALIVLLVATWRFRAFGRLSYMLIFLFMCLHVLGARYLYSYVPYDAWAEQMWGTEISGKFGWERNHYDRLVHLFYGLLLYYPAWELLRRKAGAHGAWGHALALSLIVATSALYELGEWVVALVLAPDDAERYNGQQGDMWDAQKDTALALAGAIVAMLLVALTPLVRRAPGPRGGAKTSARST